MYGTSLSKPAFRSFVALLAALLLTAALVRAAQPDDDAAAVSPSRDAQNGENAAVDPGSVERKADAPAAVPQPSMAVDGIELRIRLRDGTRETIKLQERGPGYPFVLGTSMFGLEVDDDIEVARAQLQLGKTGVAIRSVTRNLPADKAGLQENDIILAVGDQEMNRPSDLTRAGHAADGSDVTIRFLRAGEERTVTVTPRRPDSIRRTRNYMQRDRFRDFTPADRRGAQPSPRAPQQPSRAPRQNVQSEIDSLKKRLERLEQMIQRPTADDDSEDE